MTKHERNIAARIPPNLCRPFVQTIPVDGLRRAANALRIGPLVPKVFSFTYTPAKPIDRQYSQGSVYFVDCGRYTKIGHTWDLKQRLEGIETHNPFPLKLWARIPGDIPRERRIHAALRAERHRREWFELSAEQKALLRAWVLKVGGEVYQ